MDKNRESKTEKGKKSERSHKFWKIVGRTDSIIGIIIAVFTVVIFFLVPSKALDLTLFIHGPKGKMDIVINNEGSLVIDFGNDRREAIIGENGRVNFEEIPNRFKNKHFTLGLEDVKLYELKSPEKEYEFSTEPIYVPVNRINKIHGVIHDYSGLPVDRAQVTIDRNPAWVTYSNRLGKFEIEIPQADSKDNYEIIVEKPLFDFVTEHYNIGSGPADIQIKLKEIDTSNIIKQNLE